MQPENRVCQNCNKGFTIRINDFVFYKKMGVLLPKLCPDCRAQLRLSFRNERFLYKRKCDKCSKVCISMFSSSKDFTVWCHDCWWGDEFDGRDYGLDYDSRRPFLEQWKELWNRVPKPALVFTRAVDSPYLNYAADQKNCYMVIESSNDENCINCYWIQLSKDLVDSSFTNKVELSYEVDDCYDSQRLKYSKGCHGCFNSAFLFDCRNCNDCLGCVNLRGQKYSIFNRAYSKEEYFEKLKEYRLDTYTGVEKFKNEFKDFIKKHPRKFAQVVNTLNSTGNYLNNVKNSYKCFHSYEAEDNAYSVHVWRGAKDCFDCNTAGRTAEKIYNSLNIGIEVSNVVCSSTCWGSQFVEYCFNSLSSQHCFGCVGVRNKKYCILNKQYSKEEYDKIKSEIVSKMKDEGIYGEFFPREFSSFGYNESSAMDEFPLNKDEALMKGFKWEDTERGTYGKETIIWSSFPDSILDLSKDFDITNEVFKCLECSRNYRIIENELGFYKRMEIPIPRTCPECRHEKIVRARGPNRLWNSKCMCVNEGHDHHKFKTCQNDFETSYSPEREEILYCEECYNKEVY